MTRAFGRVWACGLVKAAGLVIAFGALVAPTAGQDPEAFLGSTAELFVNLTLVDGRGGPPQANAAILVWNGRVRSAGPRSHIQTPQGTQIVDLEGAFVIPGLIDVSATPRDSVTLAAMLAAGITGVREAAMPLNRFVRTRREVPWDGPLPDVFIGGPILEGPGGSTGVVIASDDDIEAEVGRMVEDGAEFVSVGPTMPWEWVRDIARAARAEDAAVWVEPRSEGWQLALRSGADVTSGVVSLDPELLPESARVGFASTLATSGPDAVLAWLGAIEPDGPEVDAVISALLARDAAVAPLLASVGTLERCGAESTVCEGWTSEQREALRTVWPRALELVGAFRDNEIRLLVGSGPPTDIAAAARYHDELELLVGAGLEPLEALSAATRNGAIALGELHRRGTIEADKRADFVVLEADPTRDIANTRRIRFVVLRGRAWAPGPDGGLERLRFR